MKEILFTLRRYTNYVFLYFVGIQLLSILPEIEFSFIFRFNRFNSFIYRTIEAISFLPTKEIYYNSLYIFRSSPSSWHILSSSLDLNLPEMYVSYVRYCFGFCSVKCATTLPCAFVDLKWEDRIYINDNVINVELRRKMLTGIWIQMWVKFSYWDIGTLRVGKWGRRLGGTTPGATNK